MCQLRLSQEILTKKSPFSQEIFTKTLLSKNTAYSSWVLRCEQELALKRARTSNSGLWTRVRLPVGFWHGSGFCGSQGHYRLEHYLE
jgi:hypothetical protein